MIPSDHAIQLHHHYSDGASDEQFLAFAFLDGSSGGISEVKDLELAAKRHSKVAVPCVQSDMHVPFDHEVNAGCEASSRNSYLRQIVGQFGNHLIEKKDEMMR